MSPAKIVDEIPNNLAGIPLLIHWLCAAFTLFISIWIYVHPLLSVTEEEAVVDEMHLVDPNRPNPDVLGMSSLWDLLQNDYWGRPLAQESSHKSWRPLAVLILRYLNNQKNGLFHTLFPSCSPLLFHRTVNVLAHAILSQLVGWIARDVFVGNQSPWIRSSVQWMAVLLFSLHPAHVEAVANVANRTHILGMLFVLSSMYARSPISVLLFASALLCSETALFQFPALVLTTTLIRYNRQSLSETFFKSTLPRIVAWTLVVVGYLGMRFALGALAIPKGLMERAETPFVHLHGWDRLRSFAYVVAVHMAKSLGMDPLGFAHEYSYNCVPALVEWSDSRCLLPLLVAVVMGWISLKIVRTRDVYYGLVWLTVLAWWATLFPISGILKVGTFIADRMVLPSSLLLAVGGSHVWSWFFFSHKWPVRLPLLLVTTWMLLGFWGSRVERRTIEWTSHSRLLERARITCQDSAKNLLQLSKLRMNDPKMRDLQLALELLQEAEAVDPEFCRVHFQYAHIYLRQTRYLDMETHLLKSLQCPTTANAAMELWQKYWPVALKDDEDAKRRYNDLVQRMNSPTDSTSASQPTTKRDDEL